MIYRKNLAGWERVARIAGAVLMTGCAIHFGLTPIGAVFGAAAMMTVATGLVGWCPVCAVTRRPS